MARSRRCTDEDIIQAVSTSDNMSDAARKCGIHLSSFKIHAKRLGLYKPNQSGKGIKASDVELRSKTIPLVEILRGMHSQYQTLLLKRRLIKEGIKSDVCEGCGFTGGKCALTLDHINGVGNDHRLENLRILCPNCHAATDTFAGRNKKSRLKLDVDSEEKIIRLLMDGCDSVGILTSLGYTPNGANHRRVERLRRLVNIVLGI